MTMLTDEGTLNSIEVAALVGVSYRILDHWLRQGYISLACPQTPGSGNRRTWTTDEIEAVKLYAAEYHRIAELQDALRDGRVWERSIAQAEALNA